jgi:hypothetical protein
MIICHTTVMLVTIQPSRFALIPQVIRSSWASTMPCLKTEEQVTSIFIVLKRPFHFTNEMLIAES